MDVVLAAVERVVVVVAAVLVVVLVVLTVVVDIPVDAAGVAEVAHSINSTR